MQCVESSALEKKMNRVTMHKHDFTAVYQDVSYIIISLIINKIIADPKKKNTQRHINKATCKLTIKFIKFLFID